MDRKRKKWLPFSRRTELSNWLPSSLVVNCNSAIRWFKMWGGIPGRNDHRETYHNIEVCWGLKKECHCWMWQVCTKCSNYRFSIDYGTWTICRYWPDCAYEQEMFGSGMSNGENLASINDFRKAFPWELYCTRRHMMNCHQSIKYAWIKFLLVTIINPCNFVCTYS